MLMHYRKYCMWAWSWG